MLRQVICGFQRAITIQTNCTPQGIIALQHKLFHNENHMTLCKNNGIALNTQDDFKTNTLYDSDTDYIVPYPRDEEGRKNGHVFVAALRTRFRLKNDEIRQILKDETVQRACRERALVYSLDILLAEGVSKASCLEYPWLLTIEKSRLELKLKQLKLLKMRDINHWVPFLKLSVTRLHSLCSGLRREADIVPYGNRVYYISEKLGVDPQVVTKYLSKRLFILEMPFDIFESNLKHMIDYNVSPMNLLKDLWAFRYTPKSVKNRLERVKVAKKEKVMPWMIRCPENILQRSIKLTLDELAVLGNKTVAKYLGERLQFTEVEAKAIMAKHPQVQRVRVTKIKEVLDYLLGEGGFSRFDIAQVPRILCHSLETTKFRIEELKSIGCRPSTLVIICRSKREYEKFVKQWMDTRNKSHTFNESAEDNKST
ncbi:transcription termination factor, mitochondrial-like [Teleopsis dalmanni]|uniref:transcription termination factor, mitochondrial-like n=1 Tax=Teleopsis dalmanni TaxID=139649 RepID=UPI0018CD8725|nr:transcription termination factor, mitochondrial-like [Teleopsis dalmanni]XP_037929033.1 transcription termination factor, mitochondrial-like [Teleopsis dalmanni]XP_037929363.1 transcription termination factor, mitochondrial-like [Teleopsis dalmanni]